MSRFWNEVNLHEVASEIEDADLALTAGHSLISKLVQVAGRSEFSHAAKLRRWGEEIYCCEMREFVGGRIVTLASQVRRHPGCIYLFKLQPRKNETFDRQAAAEYACKFAGQEYGWSSVLVASASHLPIVRLFARHDYRAEGNIREDRPVFCSQHCALSDRAGGIDTVPFMPDNLTLPGDLARSGYYRRLCRLMGV